jgi:NAD(P)-dependent dehydrogenase (short-subunit alcohol dehydrogenase family)
MRLSGKIALITSARHPCARAIVLGFAREGADCAIIDDDRAQADALAAAVRRTGRRALAFGADITDKSALEEIVRRTAQEFGRIDILLNCSAISHDGEFLSFSEEAFNRCLERGPKAYFLASQAVGRVMSEQRSGKIINLSNTDGRIASGESAGNSAACSSIESMTRGIAQALAFYGVNVNALAIGPMQDSGGTEEETGERMRRIPLGRLARAEDVVGAALFLASDDSSFVCGESVYVDAGYHNAAVTEDSFRPAWGRVWSGFEIPPAKK